MRNDTERDVWQMRRVKLDALKGCLWRALNIVPLGVINSTRSTSGFVQSYRQAAGCLARRGNLNQRAYSGRQDDAQ